MAPLIAVSPAPGLSVQSLSRRRFWRLQVALALVVLLAGCARKQAAGSGVSEPETPDPLEEFLYAFVKEPASTEPPPISVTAEFKRNVGYDYIHFHVRNIADHTIRTTNNAMPWSGVFLVGVAPGDRHLSLNREGLKSLYEPGGIISPGFAILILPGGEADGYLLIPALADPRRDFEPAPHDVPIRLYWRYSFRERNGTIKSESTAMAFRFSGMVVVPPTE